MRRNQRFYKFDSFIVDEDNRLLFRDSEQVSVTPKSFDLLLVLVTNPGQVLTKEELMEQVWPDSFVEEANLAVNVSMIRKALGEMPDGRQYVETLPRRGYRFAANVRRIEGHLEADASSLQGRSGDSVEQPDDHPVEARAGTDASPAKTSSVSVSDIERATPSTKPVAEAEASRKQRTGWPGSGLALVAVIAVAVVALAGYLVMRARSNSSGEGPVKRLAVLPFENLRPSEQTDYLAFALADSVINRLESVGSLIVRPSSYVEKYGRQKKTPREIASELDVDILLTGSYVQDGDDLVVNAQLVDVAGKQNLWSESMNLKFEKLLELQDYVARQVAKGLDLKLAVADGNRFNRQAGDPLAYEYLLRSQYLLSTSNQSKAIELLTESVHLDPNNAVAWAYLGRAYHINALQFSGDRRELAEAEADYEQALTLDPGLSQARLMMAKLYTETGRVERSVGLLLELNKTSPLIGEAHWELSYAYRYGGLLNESIEEGERALQIDSRLSSHQFNSYLYAGQYQKFMDSLPSREDSYVVFYRGLASYYLNDFERAAATFDRCYELNSVSVISQVGKALRLGIAGKNREGLDMLRAAENSIARNATGDGEIAYKIAQAYQALGDKASALNALDRAVSQGFFCYSYLASDPLLRGLQGDPAFQATLEKARARHEKFQKLVEELKKA